MIELYARIAKLETALEHARDEGAHVVVGAIRERLPRRRVSSTFAFRVADCEGYVTVGEYEDGRPGEVFIKVAKQGSTLAGHHGRLLHLDQPGPAARRAARDLREEVRQHEVRAVGHDRRRRPAHRDLAGGLHLPSPRARLPRARAEREELGVLSTSERLQPTLPEVAEQATPDASTCRSSPPWSRSTRSPRRPALLSRAEQRDAPMCYQCGNAHAARWLVLRVLELRRDERLQLKNG